MVLEVFKVIREKYFYFDKIIIFWYVKCFLVYIVFSSYYIIIVLGSSKDDCY